MTFWYEKIFPKFGLNTWISEHKPDFTAILDDKILAVFDAKNYSKSSLITETINKMLFAYMTSGKITNSTDVSRVAELLSEGISYWKDKMIIPLEDWTLLKVRQLPTCDYCSDFRSIAILPR